MRINYAQVVLLCESQLHCCVCSYSRPSSCLASEYNFLITVRLDSSIQPLELHIGCLVRQCLFNQGHWARISIIHIKGISIRTWPDWRVYICTLSHHIHLPAEKNAHWVGCCDKKEPDHSIILIWMLSRRFLLSQLQAITQVQDKRVAVTFVYINALRGILMLVGIWPVSFNSSGSRTSIRTFSGWLGRSLTSS